MITLDKIENDFEINFDKWIKRLNEKKKIYVFDIDGCILPSIFPKLLKKNQTREEQAKLIKEINEQGYNIELYPKFIDFYFKNCFLELIYFVTGRKRSDFEKLTYHHLSSLQYENIYFYPEDGLYTRDFYLNWKYNTISKIVLDNGFCYVFDDEKGYFNRLSFFNCLCFLANSNDAWNKLKKCIF